MTLAFDEMRGSKVLGRGAGRDVVFLYQGTTGRMERTEIKKQALNYLKCETRRPDTIRLASVRFGTVRFGSVRVVSVRSGSVRYGSLRFVSVRFDSARFGTREVAAQP